MPAIGHHMLLHGVIGGSVNIKKRFSANLVIYLILRIATENGVLQLSGTFHTITNSVTY
jgi:hypothetical protein